MRVVKLVIPLFFFCQSLFSQMTVVSSSVATSLAQTIAGYGVTVSNASLSCTSNGAATFTYTGTHLGLTGGVLLTTGDATTAAQPQVINSSTDNGNNVSDPQLTNIEALATHNLCKLEFDFVPICPNLSIKYVFASEEYPSFVGAGYNDAFGIFLTGPNPSGAAYNNQNIATLPNGQPVSINNVNSSSNSSSFVANYTLNYTDIVYGGYTVPITSTASMTPCQSYHIEFAIADAGDGAYDSGVFIQYDGLTCTNSPTITTNTVASSCTGNTGSASVTVTGASPLGYSWQPGGQTTSSITSQAPGTYTCVMTFSSSCSTFTQAQVVTIPNAAVSPTAAVSSNTPCPGSTLSFTTTSNATTYSWSGPNGFSSASQNPSIPGASPAITGTYTLVVTNVSGCTNTVTLNTALAPSPTVTVNSPSVCSGGTATLTASGANTYTWSPGLSSTTGSVVTASPPATTAYTVTGASTAGCPGINTATVTITASPIITVSSATVCAGNQATLTASGATSYSWSPATALSTTSGSIVTASPVTTTVYTVSGSVGTCSANPGTGTVTAIPLPTVTIGSNSPVCVGSALNLTAGGGSSYAWSGPGGYASFSQNPTINPAATSNSGVYTVTVTTLAGCSNTNTVSVTVNSSAPANISPLPAACINSNVTLNAPNGGAAYAWSGPAGFTSSQQNPTVNGVTTANGGVYTLTMTSQGCLSTGTVNLSLIGPVSFAATPADQAICALRSAVLSASGQGGTGTFGYSWAPATGLNSTSAPNVVSTPNATQVYTVTLNDAQCPGAPTASVAVTVSVNPLPVITFSTPLAAGCEAFCTSFTSQSIPATQNASWVFSNGQSATGSNLTQFCFNSHGNYDAKLIVQDVNGCIDSLTKPGYITVYPKPIANFTWDPLTPTVISNTVNFYDQSTLGTPMLQWSWNFGDFFGPLANDTSNTANPSHTYQNVGTYTVTLGVVNQYGCRDSVIKPITVEDEFALFIPNAFTPSVPDGNNDVFNVKGSGFFPDPFEMYIFDRWGEVIFHTDNVAKGWDGSVKGGTRAKQDVYVYKIIVRDFKGKKREFVGHITLL